MEGTKKRAHKELAVQLCQFHDIQIKGSACHTYLNQCEYWDEGVSQASRVSKLFPKPSAEAPDGPSPLSDTERKKGRGEDNTVSKEDQ